MKGKNGYVLLGPDVVKVMLKALDTLAIAAASHPTFGHHSEWDDLGTIANAITLGEYSMPVLDDNVEVVTTIYPWGHELVNPPMPNTSWDSIVDYIDVNVKCGVIVNVEFTPKEK